jgi:splicing factor 3A subunit 1
MAQDATSNDASDSMDVISKPPPGVVLPPKEIRTVAEKTAGYVFRNGAAFEDRIREKNLNNPKFSFLKEGDAYRAFYEWRIAENKQGRGTDIAAGREGQPAAAPQKPAGPPEPPEFHFSARMPNISAQDLEIVRLTALYVAKNGRAFLTALSQKENGNYQFDFLRPQHGLNQFFTRLVDQYTELLTGETIQGSALQKTRMAELEHNVKDRFHVLQRAKQRAEYVRYKEQQQQKQEDAAEKERIEYHQIDWQDFVLVETVLFNEADDQAELPPPPSLNDLQSASLEQKAMMSLQPANMRIEEAMPDEDLGYAAPAPPVQVPTPQLPYHLPPPVVPTPEAATTPQPAAAYAGEDEEAIRERTAARDRAQEAQQAAKAGPGQMRIRNDYVPRAQAKRKNQNTTICSVCGQAIENDAFAEHMRIELLSEDWKGQKAKEQLRNATTNLSSANVAENLKRLASQRSDVFDGVTGQPISEEEQARRKRAALSYDGTPETRDAIRTQQIPAMNVEDQIKQLHQKYGQQQQQ